MKAKPRSNLHTSILTEIINFKFFGQCLGFSQDFAEKLRLRTALPHRQTRIIGEGQALKIKVAQPFPVGEARESSVVAPLN